MSGLFSSPRAPAPPPYVPPPAVAPINEEAQKAALDERRRIGISRRGRQSTILTGGQGLAESPVVRKKKLLGG